jgi:hypothetical protein
MVKFEKSLCNSTPVKFNNSVARVNQFFGECQFNRGACQSKLGLCATRRRKEFQPRMNTDRHGFLLPQENAWNAKS